MRGLILKGAVVAILLAVVPILQAQTTNGDINLKRLADAIKAINDNELPHAEELLNSVLAALPDDPDALNLLGVIRAKQNRSAEAERLIRRALARSPTHLSAHKNLSELLLTTNRSSEAMVILLRAHKLAPNRPEINLTLARLYLEKNNYRQAHEHLGRVPREASSDDYFLLMLKTLIGLKHIEAVRALDREFRNRGSGLAETQADFAMLLATGGFNEEALSLLQAAQEKTPASFPILYGLGIVNAAVKQFGKAEEYLSAALKIRSDDLATLRALARVARATGHLEKALSHLVEARRLAPNSAVVMYDFGVTALQMDLFLDALPVFEKLHRDYPREVAYLYALAATHLRKGETVETTRLMNNYVALQPRDPSGFYLLGAALLAQDLFEKARAALERSLSLRADPDTEYLLGVSLEKLGNRVAAIATFQRVVDKRPDHATAFSALGAAYRERGKYTEARTALERAVQLNAEDLRATYQLGLVYAKLGENEAAKRMFARADDLRGKQRNQESVVLKLIDPPQ